jgi:hypothetical protein
LSSGSCPEDILPAGRRGLHGTTQIVLKPSWKVIGAEQEHTIGVASASGLWSSERARCERAKGQVLLTTP